MSAVYELPLKASLEHTLLASHPPAVTTVSELEIHPSPVNCTNLQVESVLQSIESEAIREALQPVFSDLLRFLDCLQLFEGFFADVDQAHETLAMFELVHVEGRSVVNNIRSLTMQTSRINDDLIDTLDGIAFAIGHDLHRVFDRQLKELPYQAPSEDVIGELVNSHGLLTNCAQQSIITLAQHFEFTSARLFEDANARLTESLVLCHDLTELIQFVRGWEVKPGEFSATAIVEQVVKFRHGSMKLLMYRDWKEYEMFSAKITLASADSNALAPVLDSFGCYLETLLRLVSSRSVLSDMSRRPFPSEIQWMPLEN